MVPLCRGLVSSETTKRFDICAWLIAVRDICETLNLLILLGLRFCELSVCMSGYRNSLSRKSIIQIDTIAELGLGTHTCIANITFEETFMPENLFEQQVSHLLKPLPSERNSLQDQALALLHERNSQTLLRSSGVLAATSSQREFAENLEKFAQKNFSAIDDNGDKYLSHAEVKLYAQRGDLSQQDKAMASFIEANYHDMNKLTARTGFFKWDNLKEKSRDELTMADFQMLRIASDATQRQNAVREKQAEGQIFDYFEGGAYGALGGTLFTAGFAKLMGPRAGGALVLAGAIAGALGGAGLAGYFRSHHYIPGCQNFYDQKRDLSKQILDRVK